MSIFFISQLYVLFIYIILLLVLFYNINNITYLKPKNIIIEVYEPPPRKEGIIVADVHELVDKLRNEAKVIS